MRSYAAMRWLPRYWKFKEGGMNITFLIYDETFEAMEEVLAFIQQYDVAFKDEGFLESSKLWNVAMHFQKLAHQ